MLTGLTPNTLYCFQARQVVGGIETVIPATASGGTTAGSITISDTTCTEGTACSFTVTQTGGTAPATVTYSTGNGSATGGVSCTVGVRPPDFMQVTAGTVVVPANGTMPISVGTCTGAGVQPSDTFFVILSTTTSGTIADSSGQATISAG